MCVINFWSCSVVARSTRLWKDPSWLLGLSCPSAVSGHDLLLDHFEFMDRTPTVRSGMHQSEASYGKQSCTVSLLSSAHLYFDRPRGGRGHRVPRGGALSSEYNLRHYCVGCLASAGSSCFAGAVSLKKQKSTRCFLAATYQPCISDISR